MRTLSLRREALRLWLALAPLALAALALDATAAPGTPIDSSPVSVAPSSAVPIDATPPGLEGSAVTAGSVRALWQFDTRKARAVGRMARPGVHPILFDSQSIDAWQPGESG